MASPSVATAPNLRLGGGIDPNSAPPLFCDQLSCLQCFVLTWANDLPTTQPRPPDPLFCSPPKIKKFVPSPLLRRRASVTDLMSPKKKAGPPTTPKRSSRTGSSTNERQADENLPNDETPIVIRARPQRRTSGDLSSPSRTQSSSRAPSVNLGHIPKLQSGPGTESSTSRTSRASSPSKKRNTYTSGTLEEYPIRVVRFEDIEDLPSDVHPVYRQILGLVNNGLPVIPRRWEVWLLFTAQLPER
jgi:hypothetical protein